MSLAEIIYDEGREQGIVGMTAGAAANGHTAATARYPKFPEEEARG